MQELWIEGGNASRAEIYAGTDAARAVFTRWRLPPEHCLRQVQALADGDAYGKRGVSAWLEAEREALAVTYEGRTLLPPGARLVLRAAPTIPPEHRPRTLAALRSLAHARARECLAHRQAARMATHPMDRARWLLALAYSRSMLRALQVDRHALARGHL